MMNWHRHHRPRRRGHRERHRHGGWGPWGFRGRFFRPGELRLALLSLLGEQARHGYDLMKELERRSGGLYRASAGSVYPILQQLEDEGLAHSRADAGKRIYEITEAGREELELEDDVIDEIWRRSEEWGSWGFGHVHSHDLWRMLKALHRASQRVAGGGSRPDRRDLGNPARRPAADPRPGRRRSPR